MYSRGRVSHTNVVLGCRGSRIVGMGGSSSTTGVGKDGEEGVDRWTSKFSNLDKIPRSLIIKV